VIARRSRTGLGKVIVLCACAALTGAVQQASAQMGPMGGFGEMMTPDFSRRDVVLMVEGLSLDETQRLVLETLIETYEEDFRAKGDEFRDRMNAMREEARPSEEREAQFRAARERFESFRDDIRAKREKLEEEHGGEIPEEIEEKFREEVRTQMEAMRTEMREQGRNFFQDEVALEMFGKLAPISEEWVRARNQLRDQFVADLQMQLNEEQAQRWPSTERLIRRTKALQRGRISGESADIFQIVRSLNLDPEQQNRIKPILDQYEVELDEALKARDAYMDSSRSEMLRAMQTQNAEDGVAVVERQTKLRAAVRDVNDRAALNIEQALESELGTRFRDEYLVRAYPMIYSPTRMERVFTAAAQLEGLEPTVLEAVTQMQVSYLEEIKAKNASLLETVRKHEPDQAVNMTRRFAARMQGQEAGEDTDPIREAMQERGQIGDRYRDQLTQLLTEEQVAMLPMPREGEGRGWRGEGGGGPGGQWRRGGDDDDDDRPRRRDGEGRRRGGQGDGGGQPQPD